MNVSEFVYEKINDFTHVNSEPYRMLLRLKLAEYPITKLHSERVAFIAYMIGAKLKFSKEDLEITLLSAILHDIGKTKIAKDLLKKKDITPEEFDKIKSHTEYGKEIVEAIEEEYSEKISKIIYYHHERIDGDGYFKLKENEIPLISKIISLADSYDAIRAKRSYKLDTPFKEAITQVTNNCGTQFDCDLVKVLLDVLKIFNLNY